MKDIINGFTERFRKEHLQARRYVALMLVLALLTTLFVNWQLHGVGISMTADYHCGYEEHQHTAACYEKVLTCGYEEGEPETPSDTSSGSTADSAIDTYSVEEPVQTEPETILVPHEHTDACYEERRVLTCPQEEHVHGDDCFDEYGMLICEEFEHQHDDSCYTTEYELVCGLDEGELVEEPNPAYQEMPATRPVVIEQPAETTPDEPVLHHHTDACYTEELVCTIPEHHHTVECLADTQADVETADEWQAAANVALTGNWAQDLLTVAQSQLDYKQSDKNFKLDVEDQQVLRGYSRYGAWYGNPYGAWDVMFLSYCLHFAGVPQTVVPQRAGVMALHSELRGSQWLTDADGSTAQPGDIVIYNTLTTEQVAEEEDPYGVALLDLDEDADTVQTTTSAPEISTRTVTTQTVGVVSAVDTEAGTLTVISGNVDGKVAEVNIASSDVTSVISVTGAYDAESGSTGEDESKSDTTDTTDTSVSVPSDTDDSFGATVNWVGEAADSYGIALLAAVDNYDLNSWVTSISFDKDVNGSWTPIGNGNVEVTSGTKIRVNLDYTVQAGVLTPTHNTLTYQLPGGLTLPEEEKGNIVDKNDGNKVVGTYVIDTSGKATLTFTDEKFIGTDETGGAAFTGSFYVAIKVSADSFDESKKIEFKDGCTLTIDPVKPDVVLYKLGANDKRYSSYPGIQKALVENLSDGTFKVNYVVGVETTNGTKNNVTITDTLNDGEGSSMYKLLGTYVEDSFALYKVDAQGSMTQVTPFPNYTLTNGTNTRTVEIKDLPALQAGEKYLWCYSVLFDSSSFNNSTDGTGIIRNRAAAKVNGLNDVGYNQKLTMDQKRITKKGEYKPEDGQIEWTVTVSAPNSVIDSSFLVGHVIQDTLPEGTRIVGDVTVTGKVLTGGSNDRKIGSRTITADQFLNGGKGYTITKDVLSFGNETANRLVFTFRTNTPIGGGSVTNTATASKDGYTFKASDTVSLKQGDWTLRKERATSGRKPTWNITATNKAGEAEFTLWDVLRDAVNDAGQTTENTHYAYAAELDEAIKAGLTLTMHDNTKLNYQQAIDAGNRIEISYYSDTDGIGVVTADDTTTRVCSFAIRVTAGDKNNPVRSISVTGIPTHEERDDVPTGEVWTYKNTIHIDGVSGEASADDTYRSYKKFEKGVAAKSSGDETGYLTGSNSFKLSDLSGKKLHYQLVLQTSADDADEITVTDILPENVGFKLNSVEIALDQGDFNKVGDKNVTWADASYDEAARKLTVTIRDYNKGANTAHRIRIQYEVSVDSDPSWKDPSVGKLTYTNSATWGELTETTTTTVTRTVDQVKKTGEPVPGNDRRLRYRVVINPAREDLSAGQTGAQTIELHDDISTTKGAIAAGDLNSVKLYYYKYDEAAGVTTGEEVPRSMYRILEADKDGWLHMEVPNRTAMILEYECDVSDGSASGSYEVSNTVTLSNGSKSSGNNFKYTVKSEATATTAQFVLRKVDSYSGVSLEGAEFTVYQYDKDNKEWTKWTGNGSGTLITDKNGQASVTVLDSVSTPNCLNPDVLYKLVETKAPTDYQRDATPHYLLFRNNHSTESAEKAFATAAGVTEGTTTLTVGDETVDLNSNVQVGSDASTTTAEYGNVYSNLTVSKLWLDADTRQPVDPAVESIHIKVWQYTDNAENKTLFKEADLTKDNSWTATWSGDDLPLTDKQGNAYHYLVEEETTGNWNVYVDNNGVQTGNITVQNYVYTGYELPSTGGMGTAPFGVLGGAMAAAAALLLARKRKHHAEKE